MEETRAGRLHVHLMLQFTQKVDVSNKTFALLGRVPRADPNDILHDGFGPGIRLQENGSTRK